MSSIGFGTAALAVAVDHFEWATRRIAAGGGGLSPRELAASIGHEIPVGLQPEPSTLVGWIADAWLDTRNATITPRNAATVEG
ncbi:hypothetical protein [Azospirillum sp. TSH64]|uniref:hypothetical protein n=1 Tax=Azospirillum sp. TSH64 TaxID=652740 RepID=UPI000D61BE1A|nr:hypothetical protein [Azospirillum sp. TSH64]PWC81275.1 hypothetical protein TSH64_01145 [Azospirillum sp. TSH64]